MSLSEKEITQTIQYLKSMDGFVVVPREVYERHAGHMASDEEMPAGQIGTLALYDETAPDDYVFLGDNEDELWRRFAIAWRSDDDLNDIIVGRDITQEELEHAFESVVERIHSGAASEDRKQEFYAEVDEIAAGGFLTAEQAAEIKKFEQFIDRR